MKTATDKQIQKKVIKKGTGKYILCCPVCESYAGYIEGTFVFGSEHKYCWHCGQALSYDYLFEEGYKK